MPRLRKRVWIPCLIALLLPAGLLAYIALPPRYRHWRTARLLDRMEKRPDQKTVDEVCRLLAEERLSPEDGRRAMTWLLTPTITTRAPYAQGKPVGVAMDYDRLGANNCEYRLRRYRRIIEFDGQPAHADVCWDVSVLVRGFDPLSDIRSQVVLIPNASEVLGTHRLVIEERLCLSGEHEVRRLTWQHPAFLGGHLPFIRWPRSSGVWEIRGPPYRCSTRSEVAIHVVEPERAEKVALVTDVSKAQAMRDAFTFSSYRRDVDYSFRPQQHDPTIVGRLPYPDPCRIPEDIAFRWLFRQADGKSNDLPSPTVVRAQKDSRLGLKTWVDLGCHPEENLLHGMRGKHSGTLRLVPDTETAYLDPRIKRIWGEPLEFAIEFEVKEADQAK